MKSNNARYAWMFAMAAAAAMAATGCLSGDDGQDPQTGKKQYLYVAQEGVITGYDIATGEQIAGEITDVSGPTDMQALEDGTVLVNLSTRNEVLAFDGKTMLE